MQNKYQKRASILNPKKVPSQKASNFEIFYLKSADLVIVGDMTVERLFSSEF